MPTSEPESLRVVIVDDEPLARAVVREFLASHPGVQVVAECANGFEAVRAVSELSPDLMFLDVQMPKLSGFEVLDLIGRAVPVVFTTAYDEYAVHAFEVHAVDYLLKPFSAERLAEALSRATSLPLEPHAGALAHVHAFYERASRAEVVSDNRLTKEREKMARLPKGAEVLDNPVGAAPGVLEERAFELPELEPGQVRVRVAGCGLCHTDISFFSGAVKTRHPLPLVLGQQFIGLQRYIAEVIDLARRGARRTATHERQHHSAPRLLGRAL